MLQYDNGYQLGFGNDNFVAQPEKVLIHTASASLLIADCHFGKAAHFRRNHLPIPAQAAITDFHNLDSCLKKFQPQRCIFLGDLFHSATNHEWDWLHKLLQMHSGIEFILVEGNHDILPVSTYEKSGISVLESMSLGDRIFLTHEPETRKNMFNICGHIHPGFTIYGKARQHISMPCFFIQERQLIMPAFGQLTGFVSMNKRANGGQALCLAENKFYLIENS